MIDNGASGKLSPIPVGSSPLYCPCGCNCGCGCACSGGSGDYNADNAAILYWGNIDSNFNQHSGSRING
jgi:hypothetical protein